MTTATEFKKLYGVRYESEHELHLALEKILNMTISDSKFNKAKPFYPPPYGEMTLRECLFWFGYEIRTEGKTRRLVKLKARPPQLVDYSEILIERSSSMQEDGSIKAILEDTVWAREYIGIYPDVVPLGKLKSRLLELGAREDRVRREHLPLPYVKEITEDQDTGYPQLVEIDYVWIPMRNTELYKLFIAVTIMSQIMYLHPALCVAAIICDYIPKWQGFPLPFVIWDGRMASVEIEHVEIPPKIITETYLKARTQIISHFRDVSKLKRRYKPLSKRTMALFEFVRRTPKLSWTERLKRWEQEYGKYPSYKNENTMAVVYSRAKKKFLFRRKENEKC